MREEEPPSSANPFRVLHVTAPAAYGGLESVVAALAAEQRRRGYDVHMAATLTENARSHPFLDALRGDGATVHIVQIGNRAYLREISMLSAIVRAVQPDVLHSHGYRSDVIGSRVARKCGRPIISTVHGFASTDRRGRFYEFLQRRSYRSFSAVAVVSRPQIGDLVRAGVSPSKIRLIRNACVRTPRLFEADAARRLLGVQPTTFHVGWVGRLSFEKGPDVLIDAAAQLEDPDVHISLLGDGPMRPSLEARAAAAGIRDRLTCHGRISNARQVFRAFDVLVLSSRSEGTPIVILEAMAAGIPIIATSVGGVPDMLSSAEAILVPGDDPAALAAAVAEIRKDPQATKQRVDAARARLAREFSVEPWLDAYQNVYAEVVAARSRKELQPA